MQHAPIVTDLKIFIKMRVSNLFISMRSGASVTQYLAFSFIPRGARALRILWRGLEDIILFSDEGSNCLLGLMFLILIKALSNKAEVFWPNLGGSPKVEPHSYKPVDPTPFG